jgi:hypothetical protein
VRQNADDAPHKQPRPDSEAASLKSPQRARDVLPDAQGEEGQRAKPHADACATNVAPRTANLDCSAPCVAVPSLHSGAARDAFRRREAKSEGRKLTRAALKGDLAQIVATARGHAARRHRCRAQRAPEIAPGDGRAEPARLWSAGAKHAERTRSRTIAAVTRHGLARFRCTCSCCTHFSARYVHDRLSIRWGSNANGPTRNDRETGAIPTAAS